MMMIMMMMMMMTTAMMIFVEPLMHSIYHHLTQINIYPGQMQHAQELNVIGTISQTSTLTISQKVLSRHLL